MINQNITFHLPKYNPNMFCVLKVIPDKLRCYALPCIPPSFCNHCCETYGKRRRKILPHSLALTPQNVVNLELYAFRPRLPVAGHLGLAGRIFYPVYRSAHRSVSIYISIYAGWRGRVGGRERGTGGGRVWTGGRGWGREGGRKF